MKIPLISALPSAALAVVTLTTLASMGCSTTGGPFDATEIDFVTDIKPILEGRCLECHNHVNASENAGLDFETRHALLTTGRNAPVVRPGDPDNSLLLTVLTLGHTHATAMPPSPDKLWDDQQDALRSWIAQGVVWPDHVKLTRPQDWNH